MQDGQVGIVNFSDVKLKKLTYLHTGVGHQPAATSPHNPLLFDAS